MKKAEAAKDEAAKWEGIKARVEGAVERGDLTREEADAKYREIKWEMDGGKAKADQIIGHFERLGIELESLGTNKFAERVISAPRVGNPPSILPGNFVSQSV